MMVTAAAGGVAVVGLCILHLVHSSHASHAAAVLPAWWGAGVLPFAALLACIAILPLLPRVNHWWERNFNKYMVALACAALTLIYAALATGSSSVLPLLDHAIPGEYVPFMALLFALYVISGGINLRGDLPAHPGTNTAFLAVGAAIASFVGTTGASMLLIRPLLQTNRERKHVVHTVVFFIFVVSNAGGLLLPIGDPPLFLGYLEGVPFFWTLSMWPQWLLCNGILLALYFAFDVRAYRKETRRDIGRDESQIEPLRLRGAVNFIWLALCIAVVALVDPNRPLPVLSVTPFPFLRELLLLALVALSLRTTPSGVREANAFSYGAIIEVAALFAGIFVAMQVPLSVLKASGDSISEVIASPSQYFWATGMLSSMLDNAPTYKVFLQLAQTVTPQGDQVTLVDGVVQASLLTGISLGSVLMGAMTYIGNGPNFMVRAIAEQSGVRMPSFFGYVFKYSVPILIPLFLAMTLIFLR